MDKPGIKTSEFAVTIAGSLLGLAVMNGLITPAQAADYQPGLELVLGGVITIAFGVSYIIQRTSLKKAVIEAKPVILEDQKAQFPLVEEPKIEG